MKLFNGKTEKEITNVECKPNGITLDGKEYVVYDYFTHGGNFIVILEFGNILIAPYKMLAYHISIVKTQKP